MNDNGLVLIGGGGHCKSVIDVIDSTKRFTIAKILDVATKKGQTILNYVINGSDEEIEEISNFYSNFFITIGQIKSANPRIKIYNLLKSFPHINLPIIVSENAYVSKHSVIGEGTVVHHKTIINAGAEIGVNCILNTGCLIEHEAKIGNHTHISTNAIVNGQCEIGINCFVGSNTVVANNIRIADNVIIGSGSNVVKNILEPGIYAGNPAKKIN